LVGLAFAITAPVAYVFMQRWLQQFAYAVEIRWNTLALLGAGALLLAMVTVSYQAVRAALDDPVKSLRYE
jgi:putative ABC transport system permease protein